MKILNINIYKVVDDCPDLSHIGKYSANPGPSNKTIDRKAVGDYRHGEYQYFVAENSDSVCQDYNRMEAYNNGD